MAPTTEQGPVKRTFPIQILGRTLSIQSGSDSDYVEAVAELVNERMTQIRARSRSADLVEVAMLAALNLADEYLRAREDLALERVEVARWADEARRRIEGCIGPDPR